MANERRFAMAAAVALRGDYDAATLRGLARSAGDPGQVRRLLALAAIYAGSSRSEAAALGGVGLQTVRDWVLRFNAEGRAGDGQGAGEPADSRRAGARGAAPGGRGGPDAGDPRGGALAHRRSDAMAVGGVPALGLEADDEPGIARPGVSQAFGAAAPPRQGRGRRGGL